MILKIMRENSKQKWWILDDIKKVSCSTPVPYFLFKEDEGNDDIILLDHLGKKEEKRGKIYCSMCKTSLESGFCPTCKISPSMQDTFILTDPDEKTDGKASEKYSFTRLICRLSTGDELSIVFDTVAYLCSDDGKTIEKIVG